MRYMEKSWKPYCHYILFMENEFVSPTTKLTSDIFIHITFDPCEKSLW